jgi:hypothetical protein
MAEDGQRDLKKLAEDMIGKLSDEANNHFLLTWEGSKVPRGAAIGGTDVGWTQHGIITGIDGSSLGYYDRISEFGGPEGRTQAMLIGTDREGVTPPPGGQVMRVPKPGGPG